MVKLDNKLDSRMDILLSKQMKENQQFKAPVNFISKVMDNIETYEATRIHIEYKPLISSKHWIMIVSTIAVLIAYAFATGVDLSSGMLTYLKFNFNGIIPVSWNNALSLRFNNLFTGIQLNPVFSSGIAVICLFLTVNIVVIRKYYLK